MTLEQVHEVLRFPASAAEVLTWRGHLSDKTNKFRAELPISSRERVAPFRACLVPCISQAKIRAHRVGRPYPGVNCVQIERPRACRRSLSRGSAGPCVVKA